MASMPKSLIKFLLSASCLYSLPCHAVASKRSAQTGYESIPHQELGRSFDYVIVGGGPGGLVMANRLTEDPSISVAIIEAGTWAEDVVGNLSNVPGYNGAYDLVASAAVPSTIDWGFLTTPQAGINGQIVRYPRGKVLGGSSNLNAMAWADSTVGAFQRWADEVGDQSWTYDTVSKYYRKAINFTPPADTRRANSTPLYNPADTSQGGPLSVSYPAYAYAWTTWLAVAMEAIGIPNTDSFINGALNGSAWQTNTINHTTGERASADQAYLRPFLERSNLAVFNGTFAEKIIFSDNKTASGVSVSIDGSTSTLTADKEVIVAGGAFQSPQLLQVSGIGPAALLEAYNITVVADRPGVGQNMNDQIFFGISYEVNVPTLETIGVGQFLADDIEEFNTNATGRLTNPGGEYAGFEKIPADLRGNFSSSTAAALAAFPEDWPEVEYLTLPIFVGNLQNTPAPPVGNYATILATIMTPTSTGNVSITSSSMKDSPAINPNWLTTQSDIELCIAMFKRLRQVWTVPELAANLTIGDEVYPGPNVQTDAEIEAQIRNSAIPVSHASATNKMGKADDIMAVVDSHGKVYGVQNLRVVDVSIFPFLPPGTAPQAVVYMLAEKIADDVKNGS